MPRMILMIHQFMLQLKMAISSKTSFWNCFYYTLYIIVLFTFRIIDEIVERVPDCVNYRGFQQETPLHDACSSGCVQVSVSFRIFMKGGQKYVNSNFGGARKASCDPRSRSHARGAWGHAPPENFEIFYPLQSVFLQYEQQSTQLCSKSFEVLHSQGGAQIFQGGAICPLGPPLKETLQVVKKLVEKGADIGAVLVCYTIWIR